MPSTKVKSKSIATATELNIRVKVNDDDDRCEVVACGVYQSSERHKLEAFYYTRKCDGEKFKFWMCSDSGSTINVQKDVELFDDYDFKKTDPIGVQTTGGVYNRINKVGQMDILPNMYYDKDCFINIWCDFDVHNSKHIEIH